MRANHLYENKAPSDRSANEVDAFLLVASRRHPWQLSDESFDKFVFDGHQHLSIASLEGMRERTVVIQSFSKAFALPGARVGYLARWWVACSAN